MVVDIVMIVMIVMVVVVRQDTIEPVVPAVSLFGPLPIHLTTILTIVDLLQPPQGRPRRPSAPRHLHRAGPVEALPHPDQPGVQ